MLLLLLEVLNRRETLMALMQQLKTARNVEGTRVAALYWRKIMYTR